jgi:hypothetical protein
MVAIMRARTLLVLVALLFVALAAFAQTPNEFDRASGGEIRAITKSATNRLSGSLSLTTAGGALSGQRYDATLGGTAIDDRLWFFASASLAPQVRISAQPVDWTSVTTSFRQSAASPAPSVYGTLPRTFLALHSTSMLSDHATLDISISRSGGMR